MNTVWAFLFIWFVFYPLAVFPGVLLGWFPWPPQWKIIAWAIVGLLTALLTWALDAIAEHTP